MTKNSLINSLAAFLYISLVVAMINFGGKMAAKEDSFMAPVAFLSLFTLSAAVMGYIFCYQPIQLYVDGKKKQAVELFLKTVVLFACLTFTTLGLIFFRVI